MKAGSPIRFGTLWTALALFLTSCATQSYLNSPGHGAFKSGQYEVAGQLFESEVKKSRKNELLYNLDAGTSYFNAGNFDKAIPLFLRAVKLWESKDYTSISEEVAKLAISENMKTYTGEDWERVLIHGYLALSYMAVGKTEDAQVEARRIDLLLNRMRNEEKKKYKESSFARYLSALLWESTGEWDSARIDYEKAYEIDPALPGIRQDLLRACLISGAESRYSFWRGKFPGEAKPKIDRGRGEVIVISTYGSGPIKVPAGGDPNALPQLFPRPWTPTKIKVSSLSEKSEKSQVILDVEDLTKKFFEEKLAWLAARKVITLGVKAGAAYAVAKASKSEALGWLTFIALAAVDTADLRGWNTLPAGVRLTRLSLLPGTHDLTVEVQNGSGSTLTKKTFPKLKISGRKKVFLVLHEG